MLIYLKIYNIMHIDPLQIALFKYIKINIS
jgi:hypothetical protein